VTINSTRVNAWREINLITTSWQLITPSSCLNQQRSLTSEAKTIGVGAVKTIKNPNLVSHGINSAVYIDIANSTA
jgi:hypothetical protein